MRSKNCGWPGGRLASLPEFASYPTCAGAARLDAVCLFACRGSLLVVFSCVGVCVPCAYRVCLATLCGHVCGGLLYIHIRSFLHKKNPIFELMNSVSRTLYDYVSLRLSLLRPKTANTHSDSARRALLRYTPLHVSMCIFDSTSMSAMPQHLRYSIDFVDEGACRCTKSSPPSPTAVHA